MSGNSSIEWTRGDDGTAGTTWNPILGCDRVSPGCDACYAITQANIRAANPHPKVAAAFAGLTERTDHGLDWTGRVNLLPERLEQPFTWRKPRRVFVNSLADLFHDDVPTAFIAAVFDVMRRTPQHTYQILTKRHARMRSLSHGATFGAGWPLPNVWLGASVEDQKWADIRIPALLDTPAAVRWISAEPLLGPVDLANVGPEPGFDALRSGLDWVVAGGESGPGARPMHPDWARSLRDQCQAASVPFFFKQFGAWGPAPWRVEREPGEDVETYKARAEAVCATHGMQPFHNHEHGEPYRPPHKPWSVERTTVPEGVAPIRRWGKKTAGRLLDGRTWDEFPAVEAVAA